ncbi:hypothetical protein [Sediminitomix flava]|uniref:HNH endonuclease n=1 Tax=Sediminitomix flava TaxID=379075 RepID=A0A315ZGK4_SEDFL|nr:hypothetical protein [Sediminitomix flava]PWJ43874.1 hypothetical protein BC781_101220 [Sediminitomix flava]
MSLNDRYFYLCYTKRIHEYVKIDSYKNWEKGQAKENYQKIEEFYLDELKINHSKLHELREYFKLYDDLYRKYRNGNVERKKLFDNYNELLVWYDEQEGCCHYCQISQDELYKIVSIRDGNMTLNQKSKRSKGTLEIEKLDPNEGYTFENSVLACPFCNNAKSNLISEKDWREFFAPKMREYLNSILIDKSE